mmetsp:Transcript_16313/g.42342  ORF Transcript_16313/g.42342 Transcript_16313/m.42342 type:complete len:424 (-) Transcript_16313:49-1320(-)
MPSTAHGGDGEKASLLAKPRDVESGASDEKTGTSSLPEASFNMINSIVGAGMIGIPFALRLSGMIVGVILLVVMGFFTDYSIRLLVSLGERTGCKSYPALVMHYGGVKGYYVLLFAQFMFPFLGMCAYSIIVGQMYPSIFTALFGESFLSHRQPVIALMTAVIMLPLAMKRDIAGLARWSLLAICGVIFLGVVLIVSGAKVDRPAGRGTVPTIVEPNIAQAIGVMAFAYVCHHNIFLVFDSLKDPTTARMAKTTHISIGSACLLMAVVGIAGYIPFGQATQANVLDNFGEDDDLITAGRILFGMVVMLTYPIEAFVAREALETLFFPNGLTLRNHILVTLALVATVLTIALLVTDLGLVFEINGVVNANLLAYTMPGFLGAAAFRTEPWRSPDRLKPTLLFAFGVCVFVIGVTMIFIQNLGLE